MELEVRLTERIEAIQRRLRQCNWECNRLKEFVATSLPEELAAAQHQRTTGEETSARPEEVTSTDEPILETPAIQLTTTNLPQTPATPIETPVEAVTQAEEPSPEPVVETTTEAAAAPAPERKKPKRRPFEGSSNRDIEEFIGGNLLNKIGIGILIIGIGIFVKYAIDKDWIGPIGRVLIGLLSGGILLGIAHRLRHTYKAFSSVLVGGGMSVMYFSVAIAFHQYHLLGQTAAFGIMCAITASTVLFSLSYNRQEIAMLALLGGFATPFLVSTGEGNYIVLFSYILLLNVGMLVLSWFRDWKLIRISSYVLTLLLFGGWMYVNLQAAAPVLTGSLVFGTLFFVVFFAMNIAFNVRAQRKFGMLDYILLLSNTMFYYAGSMIVLNQVDQGRYMGIFTILMAAFHFAFIFPVRKLFKADENVVLMLIGLVLTFVTLAIPIQLKGSFITLFWAAEAVLLLVLAQRTKIKLLSDASTLVTALTVVGLIWDWSLLYFNGWPSGRPALVNGAFVTSLLAAAAMVALYFLYKREKPQTENSGFMSQLYQFIALPILYFGMLFELIDQTLKYDNFGFMVSAGVTFTALFLSAMSLWAIRDKREAFGNLVAGLSAVTIGAFGVTQFSYLAPLGRMHILGIPGGEYFGIHFAMVPALFLLLGLNFYHLRRYLGIHSDYGRTLIWATAAIFIFLCSVELDNVMAMFGIAAASVHKVGYPILWGLIGFAMIALGMREKLLQLRIAGLSLFLLILVKLFAYDIRAVSPGGKIAAFISLGVLLLVISFMYQRLKKLLFDTTETSETPAEGIVSQNQA